MPAMTVQFESDLMPLLTRARHLAGLAAKAGLGDGLNHAVRALNNQSYRVAAHGVH